MRKLFVTIAAAGMLMSGYAFADAIEDRKAIMKEKVGASMGVLVKTLKGEMEFDSAAVMNALETMHDSTQNFADLFPAGTETGGETTASPKIWEDMDGFKTKLAEFHGDLETAIAAQPASQADLGPLVQEIGANCQGCHETYRIQKN